MGSVVQDVGLGVGDILTLGQSKKARDKAKSEASAAQAAVKEREKRRKDQETRLAAIDRAERVRSDRLARQQARGSAGRSAQVLGSGSMGNQKLGQY